MNKIIAQRRQNTVGYITGCELIHACFQNTMNKIPLDKMSKSAPRLNGNLYWRTLTYILIYYMYEYSWIKLLWVTNCSKSYWQPPADSSIETNHTGPNTESSILLKTKLSHIWRKGLRVTLPLFSLLFTAYYEEPEAPRNCEIKL